MTSLSNKIITIVVLFSFSLPVFGQNYKTINTIIDEKSYVCLEEPDAYELLQIRMSYPKLQLKLEKTEELLDLRTQEIGILEDIVTNKDEQIQALTLENTRLHKKILEEDRWYNSKWLWTAIGFVVGAGTAVLIVYGVQEAK